MKRKSVFSLWRICSEDPISKSLAEICYDTFRRRVQLAARSGRGVLYLYREFRAGWSKLHEDLELIATPPQLEDLDSPHPPVRYAGDSTHINTEGE